MEKFERIVEMAPAFDKRSDDPKKDYGIGSVTIRMILKGKKGAVHFVFRTGMYLPETLRDGVRKNGIGFFTSSDGRPMGYDVGYHSPTPQWEGQEVRHPTKMRKTGEGVLDIAFDKIGEKPPICEYIGVPCYSDGSALRAKEWMDVLLREGSQKIWQMLEEEYEDIFNSIDMKIIETCINTPTKQQ